MSDILFSTVVGSKLYGINHADSDTDIKGYYLPDLSLVVGLEGYADQLSQNNGLTGKDKSEAVFFALPKLFRLAKSGNPTILELAFGERVSECAISTTQYAQEINKYIRDNLITKHIFSAYYGYFTQQVKKMHKITEGTRKPLIDKYGYDIKSAAHAYRLGRQFISLMHDKDGYTPRLVGHELEFCRNIRSGKYDADTMYMIFDEMSNAMMNARTNSKLPSTFNEQEFNEFYLKMCGKLYGITL